MTGRTERQYRRRAHYPARINFGITNELRAALKTLADKAGIGAVRARLRPSRRRNGQKRTAHSEPAPAHPGATRHPRRATGRGPRRWIDRHPTTHDRKEGVGLMRRRIVFSVASAELHRRLAVSPRAAAAPVPPPVGGDGPPRKPLDTASRPLPGSSLRTPGVICVWRTSSSSSISPNSGRDPGSSTGAANQANRKITSISSTRPDASKAPLRSPAATGLALGAFGKGDPAHTSFSQRPSEIRPTRPSDPTPPPRTGRRSVTVCCGPEDCSGLDLRRDTDRSDGVTRPEPHQSTENRAPIQCTPEHDSLLAKK